LLVSTLKEHGFQVQQGVGGFATAFRAEYPCRPGGPTVAFVAEYDALPTIGHGCHHHLIAAGSVYSAIAMSRLASELPGTIVCIGTPAEETVEAKIVMVRGGAFQGVDAAFMFHGGSRNNTRLIVLAVDGLEFAFRGKSAHAAAAPHEGINALDAVIMLFNSINALRQQLREDVRIHGNIVKGGESLSSIPEQAVARFLVRSRKRQYLNEVTEKVKNCARGAALQTGAELTITSLFEPGNDLLRNEPLLREYEENFLAQGGALDEEPFLLGSSDIGGLSYSLPAIHPMVQTADAGLALHTDAFAKLGKSEVAFGGMIKGMKALCLTAARLLVDPKFLEQVKSDFEKGAKG
jgi:amidohydrolase